MKTIKEIYEERQKDVDAVITMIHERVKTVRKKAGKGEYPYGEFGDALSHLVYAAELMGGVDEKLQEIIDRNGIEY